MNVSKLSLAALRDRLAAGTREVDIFHNSKSDGSGVPVLSRMVYIPRFRVPAQIWDAGAYPATDMRLGGFLIDKYQASQPDATHSSYGGTSRNTPGLVAAVSQQGVVPWTDISQTSAKIACANRIVTGRACHLATPEEWATICFLTKLLGHDIRGNNYWGRDIRDADAWESYGIKDPVTHSTAASNGKKMARVLTGTGPVTWSHNGLASGVFDIVGNVYEWLDMVVDCGRYQAIKTAAISDADGISAADVAIVISGVQRPQFWPPAGGTVLIKAEASNTDEYVVYGTLVDNLDGTYTLSGCQRGQNGTEASPHSDNAVVQQINDYCVIPGGWTARLADGGLDNTEDPATFAIADLVLGPAAASPAAGDVLQCGTEQLIITGVQGATITANRGANQSAVAAHGAGTGIARISPTMTNTTPSATGDYGAYQYASFVTMRTEPELQALAFPRSVGAATDEWKDLCYLRNYGIRAAMRGGRFDAGSESRSGVYLSLNRLPSNTYDYRGFRAALSLQPEIGDL